MRFNPFESQLEKLARTLTESFGVSVTCQGENAYTDGRRIVLPSLPDPMDEPLERMIVGFLDHEMAHVAFSDFREVEKFNRKYPGCEAMLNVVEDALIERLAMQRWPGVRANLDALLKQIKGRVRSALRKASPFRRFCTAVYLKLSHHTEMLGLKQEIVGYEDLLRTFPLVQTTADSAALSEKLLERWIRRWRQQQSANNAQSAQSDADSGGDTQSEPDQIQNPSSVSSASQQQVDPGPTSQSRNQSSDEAEDDSAVATSSDDRCSAEGPNVCEESDAAGSDESASKEEASGAKNSGALSNSGSQSDSNPTLQSDAQPSTESCATTNARNTGDFEFDPAEAQEFGDGTGGVTLIIEVVTSGIERAASKVDGSRHYRVFTRQHDRIEVVEAADENSIEAFLARGEDEVRRLRRGLANALRSAEKRWWREEQPRGSLSPRTLHRLCVDRPSLNVFRTRAQVQGKSTAVSIVLDASGSMTSSKMDIACDTVRVLLQALCDLKIPAEAITFTTGDIADAITAAAQTGIDSRNLTKRFSRLSNLEIGLIKRFEDPVKVALTRLPTVMGTGLTPLGEAMEIGARRLIVRPENRKILLAVTDGKPGCEGSNDACLAHACHVAERIADSGIELVGVGIIDDSLQEIISDTIIVNQIEELPTRLCKLLGGTLKKGVCSHVG